MMAGHGEEAKSDDAPDVEKWQMVGFLAFAASAIMIIYAALMRPTVSSDAGLYGQTEVFNTGLMQQQMMIFLGGLAGLVISLIMFATSAILKVLWRSRHR